MGAARAGIIPPCGSKPLYHLAGAVSSYNELRKGESAERAWIKCRERKFFAGPAAKVKTQVCRYLTDANVGWGWG